MQKMTANECNLLKKILLLDDPSKRQSQVNQQQETNQIGKNLNEMNHEINDEFARNLNDLTLNSSIDDYELQFFVKKKESNSAKTGASNEQESLKYLYKLLKYYKLEHYMSDLINNGFVTPVSLNTLNDKDLENRLGVSAYDLRKFAKLRAFIKQVMNTLNKAQTSKSHPTWETIPKQVTKQPLVNKSVQKAKSSEFMTHQGNSVNHPIRLQTQQKSNAFGPKIVLHDKIQLVEMKTYNYGVPKGSQQSQATRNYRKSLQKTKSESKLTTKDAHEQPKLKNLADIFVYSRKRPKLSCEFNMNDIVLVESDASSIIINESKVAVDGTQILKQNEFKFDKTFDSSVTNEQLFADSIEPFIDDPTNRVDFNCICFGQTGSGKTHTLFGSKQIDGLCAMTAKYLFGQTDQKIYCGFYEIYNGQLYDLFNEKSRLVLREDSNGLVNVVGLVEQQIHSLNQLKLAIQTGQCNRHIGCTSFNKASSRSHAVLQLRVQESTDVMSARVQSAYHLKRPKRNFRILFIDLAGSERGIDAQNNEKDNRKEGAEINQSLLALKECIRSIDQHQIHAPFRQSKLTRVLRDCFIGSGRTVLIATVSPTDDCLQCSLNTLQYANRVRQLALRKKKTILTKTNSAPPTMAQVQTSRSETDAIVSASSKKFVHEKSLVRVSKPKPVVLEFENANYKPISNDANLNDKIKIMQQQQKRLFNRETSLFHPSKINMASTPIKTNGSNVDTRPVAITAATNKASFDGSLSSNEIPLKGFKSGEAYFQGTRRNEDFKTPKKSLNEIMQKYSEQLAQIYSPLSSRNSSNDEAKINENPLSNSVIMDNIIKPSNAIVENMLYSADGEKSKSELSSTTIDKMDSNRRHSLDGQTQLKHYIDNLEKKLANLRDEMKDTPNVSKQASSSSPKFLTQKSDSGESTNSMKEINENLKPFRENSCLNMRITTDNQNFMSPNLSSVSTCSDESNCCNPETEALKKSLHKGSESLHEKVKAVSNTISQQESNNPNKKSLYEFAPILYQNQINLHRTKSLLVVAHENQLSEITETCKEEMNLLSGLRDCKMDFNEYLTKVEKILTRKASSIRDLQIQISQMKSLEPVTSQ